MKPEVSFGLDCALGEIATLEGQSHKLEFNWWRVLKERVEAALTIAVCLLADFLILVLCAILRMGLDHLIVSGFGKPDLVFALFRVFFDFAIVCLALISTIIGLLMVLTLLVVEYHKFHQIIRDYRTGTLQANLETRSSAASSPLRMQSGIPVPK